MLINIQNFYQKMFILTGLNANPLSNICEIAEFPNTFRDIKVSQTYTAKRVCRKGNSPDLRLRPPNVCLVVKEVMNLRHPGSWLRSSHLLKNA